MRVRVAAAIALLGLSVAIGCGSGAIVLGSVDTADSGNVDSGEFDSSLPEDAGLVEDASIACVDKQGTCVAVVPNNCSNGVTTGKYSCGGGVGTTCCITCPELTQLPPNFCDGGAIHPVKDDVGCTVGYSCDSDAGPAAVDAGPPTCVALGGTCKALVPGSDGGGPCGSGTALGPDKASCGAGIGVTCCIP